MTNPYVSTAQGFAKILSQNGNSLEVVFLRSSTLETLPRSQVTNLDDAQTAAAQLEERVFVRSAGKYADYDRARMDAETERQKLAAILAGVTEVFNQMSAPVFKAEADALAAWEEEKAYLESEGKRVWELLGSPTGKGEKTVAAGCVNLRTSAARVTYYDEEAALQWVKANRPELVITSESANKKALAELAERGEQIPANVVVVEDVTTAVIKTDQLVRLA